MVTPENSMPSGKTKKDASAEVVLARIDQYELLRELGGGGYGTVYLAKDKTSGVKVAVKGLPPFVKNNREELENIRENFVLVSRLTHTNIAKALVLHPAREVSYDTEDVQEKLRVFADDFLMVMEYAPGVTLSKWRKQFQERRVPIPNAIAIVKQIASALDYAHRQRIIHRDIKPANVMVETRPDGELVARVLDFGLAAEIRSSMGRVSREIHDTSGTRPYMAPEQWLGGKQGAATDQYALAVLFHELVTGEVPFASVFDTGDPMVMINAVGHNPVVLPDELSSLAKTALTRALAKKPSDRFASCTDFVYALEGKLSIEPPSIEGDVTKKNEPPPPPPFPVWKVVAVFLAVILCFGAYWLVCNNIRSKQNKAETTNLIESVVSTNETVQVVPQHLATTQTTPQQTVSTPMAGENLESEVIVIKGKSGQTIDSAQGIKAVVDMGNSAMNVIIACDGSETNYGDKGNALGNDEEDNEENDGEDDEEDDDEEEDHEFAYSKRVLKENVQFATMEESEAERLYKLGEKYAKGDGVNADDAKAIQYFTKAAAAGSKAASIEIARIRVYVLPQFMEIKLKYQNLVNLARQKFSDNRQILKESEELKRLLEWEISVRTELLPTVPPGQEIIVRQNLASRKAALMEVRRINNVARRNLGL